MSRNNTKISLLESKNLVNNILYLNVVPKYKLNSLLNIIDNPNLEVIDYKKTRSNFKKLYKNLYLNVFDILYKNNTSINLVVTGFFLELLMKDGVSKNKFLKLTKQKGTKIFIDCFYGDNLTSLYHTDWWVDSLNLTKQKLLEFGLEKISGFYLPQLYRNLPLEKAINKLKLTNIITRTTGKKMFLFEMYLSELRKTKDKKIKSWLKGESDVNCQFLGIAESNYFSMHTNLLDPSLNQASKTFALEIAYSLEKFKNSKKKKTLKTYSSIPRINEKYSLTLYKPIEKATIRLWANISNLIWSEYINNKESIHNLKTEFGFIQNPEYFYYYNNIAYKFTKINDFVSPYEAFINMQSLCKKPEILLYNRV